jgi:hypothetical protein
MPTTDPGNRNQPLPNLFHWKGFPLRLDSRRIFPRPVLHDLSLDSLHGCKYLRGLQVTSSEEAVTVAFQLVAFSVKHSFGSFISNSTDSFRSSLACRKPFSIAGDAIRPWPSPHYLLSTQWPTHRQQYFYETRLSKPL